MWLAEDDALDSLVAVKVLAENWAHQLDVRTRFIEEARILRRADSDRLVRVLDIGELEDGRPYFVMTYAEGGTLADRLASGPLDVEVARALAVEISQGVVVLHDLGIIHRDLTPPNVFFGTDGAGKERVLIADLGLAKAVAHASGFTVTAGSKGYMAPEQARVGGGIDVRADVYAVGALTYHMLTGVPPELVSSTELEPASQGSQVAAPSTLREDVPAHIDHIVLRALDPDPERRWPTASSLAEALESLSEAPTAEAAALKPRSKPPWRRRLTRRRVITALATTAVLGLTAGILAMVLAPPTEPVRIKDASGVVSVEVPADWAKQVQGSGWDPGHIQLYDEHAPGLAVAPSLDAWRSPGANTPGAFVGISRELGKPGTPGAVLPEHKDCRRNPDREYRSNELTGHVLRWTGCRGTSVSFSEVLLTGRDGTYGVYVQIKQVGQTDRTDEILDSLRLSPR